MDFKAGKLLTRSTQPTQAFLSFFNSVYQSFGHPESSCNQEENNREVVTHSLTCLKQSFLATEHKLPGLQEVSSSNIFPHPLPTAFSKLYYIRKSMR